MPHGGRIGRHGHSSRHVSVVNPLIPPRRWTIHADHLRCNRRNGAGLISERTQEAAQLKAANKRFTESIFGWDVDEDGMLVPNWDEQDTIDWMEWQVNNNGMSASAVARSLNGQGIKGKRGGDWQSHSVSRIIANEFHANRVEFEHPDAWGSMPWHRLTTVDEM